MRIGFEIALGLVGIAALVGVFGYLSTSTHRAVRVQQRIGSSAARGILGASELERALGAIRVAARPWLDERIEPHPLDVLVPLLLQRRQERKTPGEGVEELGAVEARA